MKKNVIQHAYFLFIFFAIEILQLSSICFRIFCRLFDFAFFFSLAILPVIYSSCFCFVVAERSHRKVRLNGNNKKPAKLTNKQISYKSYRASQMTIEQCVQRITANRNNYIKTREQRNIFREKKPTMTK